MVLQGINIDEFRTLLKFDGIKVEYTNEELEILIKSKIRELEGLTGADIYPNDYTSTSKNIKGNVYTLEHYPITQIAYLYLDDKLIPHEHYNVNYDSGVIYIDKKLLPDHKPHHHYYYRQSHRLNNKPRHPHDVNIRVMYSTGISDKDFEYLILPLIKDMVGYSISYGTVNTRLNGMAGFVNSMREGDLSLNFGSNNGAGNNNYGYSTGVNNRIDDLVRKYKYNARVALL